MLAYDTLPDRRLEHVTDHELDERFQEQLRAIIPEVRRRHAGYSDERVFETAVHLAAYRLWRFARPDHEPDGAA